MSNAVRSELGLATAQSAMASQSLQLAALLCTAPRVVATWRKRNGEEPNVVSPLLERLQFVARRACGDELVRVATYGATTVEAALPSRPAPSAPGLMPPRLSASAAQSLVDCAYRFYARYLLGLAELEDVAESPDKRDYGEALHAVLLRFHREQGARAFHEAGADALAAELRAAAEAVFGAAVTAAPAMLSFKRRFDGLVPAYVEWLQERSRDGWRWQASEEAQARTLTLTGGATVQLYGRIDRLDGRRDERELIDYKARSAEKLAKALNDPGEEVQLPFYGLLLPRRPSAASYLAFERAKPGEGGVSLVPAPEFAAAMDALEERLARDLQRITDGAALPAIGAPSVCRYCEMRGLCRRGHWGDAIVTPDDEA
jgi:ATP-dependent helicase/nuclease subunit B